MRTNIICLWIIVGVFTLIQSAKVAQPSIMTVPSRPQFPDQPECLECITVLTSLIIKNKKLRLAMDKNYVCEQARNKRMKRYRSIKRKARGNIRALANYQKNVEDDRAISEKDKDRIMNLIKISLKDSVGLMKEIQMLLKGQRGEKNVRIGQIGREDSRRDLNSKPSKVQFKHHLQMLQLAAIEPALSFLKARVLLEQESEEAQKQIEMQLQEVMKKVRNVDCTITFSTHIAEKDRKRLSKYDRSIQMEILSYIGMIKKTIKAGKDELHIYYDFVDLATIRLIQLNRLELKTYFTYIREKSIKKKQKIYKQVVNLVKKELKQLKQETLNAEGNEQLTAPRRKEVLQLLGADMQKGEELLNELNVFIDNSKPKKKPVKEHNEMKLDQFELSLYQEYMQKIQTDELKAVLEALRELKSILFGKQESKDIENTIRKLEEIQDRIIKLKPIIKKSALPASERRVLTDYINKVSQEIKTYISNFNSLR